MAALFLALPCLAGDAITCDGNIQVLQGQFVRFDVDVEPPESSPGALYDYLWSADLSNPATILFDEPPGTDENYVEFDAPETLGTYKVSVQVWNRERDACEDTTCYTFEVLPLQCPLYDNTQCETTYETVTFDYLGHWDNTLVLNWFVNGNLKQSSPVDPNSRNEATDGTFEVTIDLLDLPLLNIVNECTDIAFQIMDSDGNELIDDAECTSQICLIRQPTATISAST